MPHPVPPLEELRPLAELAAKVGLSLRAAHRWRLDRRTPLRAWRVGKSWATTEAEVVDFIRRRTEASEGVHAPAEAAAPVVYSRARRKQIEAAKDRVREALKLKK